MEACDILHKPVSVVESRQDEIQFRHASNHGALRFQPKVNVAPDGHSLVGYDTAMEQPIWNFEQEPFVDEDPDETSINLRAYLDRMPDEKMRRYSPQWSDTQAIDWCGDFKDDGTLMIACCERDVDVAEFRRVLEQAIAYRNRVRSTLLGRL